MKSKTKLDDPKAKDYSRYAFSNFSAESMEGEEWKDIPQFDGCYSVSNYGRIWAAARPVNTITGQSYYTKERIRKQNMVTYFNTYSQDYTEQLCVKLRYEGGNYSFKVSRLVYELFVGPLHVGEDHLLVVHKDGDNCNNRFDNLVLMNGTELYAHRLLMKRTPRTGHIIKKGPRPPSTKNAPQPVVRYSLDGKKRKEYDSLAQAAIENNVHRSSIRAVAQQKLVQLHGMVYRFKDTPYHGEHADFSYEKKVTQYTLNGRKIRTYSSVKKAADQVGTDPNTLSKCALKQTMTCSGFVWRYEGDTYGGEYKDKIKNKPRQIVQYSLEGKKIAAFESVNEAARLTGYSAATLLDCAFKRSKVAHGFVWRFKSEAYSGEHKLYRRGKPVTRYSLEGKKIDSYPTIEIAARATGLTAANIQKNVNGFNKTAGGFIWKPATAEEIVKMPFEPVISSGMGEGKEVIQYSVEGKKLKVFTSITEAAKACSINATGISTALDKPNRTAAGFVWRTKGNRYRGSIAKAPPSNKSQIVTQYDMKGTRVCVYKSTRDAQKITGISASTISFVARGKLKSTGGFIWYYGDGPAQIDIKKHFASSEAFLKSISKPVQKYSLSGEFLKEYPSIQAAAREEGIRAKSISSAINGQSKSAGGDLWKLKVATSDSGRKKLRKEK